MTVDLPFFKKIHFLWVYLHDKHIIQSYTVEIIKLELEVALHTV